MKIKGDGIRQRSQPRLPGETTWGALKKADAWPQPRDCGLIGLGESWASGVSKESQ